MKSNSRRQFVKSFFFVTLASFSPLFLKKLWSAQKSVAKPKEIPLPAGQTAVALTDPIAQALGYRPNIKDIDYTKYPQRKKPEAKNQFCKGCALYTSVNEGWGKCTMISSGLVAAEGWCGSWNKKG